MMKRVVSRHFSEGVEASIIKKLRKLTGAPLMQCKQALEENEGNIDQAK